MTPEESPCLVHLPEVTRTVCALVESLADDAWRRPTPCAGWDVTAVLRHLTLQHLLLPHLLRGEDPREAAGRYAADLLVPDARRSTKRALTASLMAWAMAEPAVVVATPWGPVPAAEYAGHALRELVVHGSDLAVAVGAPYDPPDDAVEAVIALERPAVAAGRRTSMYGPATGDGGPRRLGVLLGLTGRTSFRQPA